MHETVRISGIAIDRLEAAYEYVRTLRMHALIPARLTGNLAFPYFAHYACARVGGNGAQESHMRVLGQGIEIGGIS
jgi:hypothetical protein